MLKEVANDVFKIELPMAYGMGDVNSYLIKDGTSYTIFDTGECTEGVKMIWEKVIKQGFDIKKIVITHTHPDHIGLVSWFKENYETEVMMAEKGYEELLKEQKRFVNGVYTFDEVVSKAGRFGAPKTKSYASDYYKYETYHFEPTKMFKENDIIPIGAYKFRAIWTPGHARDHFCFYDEKHEIFITGDHILKDMNPIVMIEKEGENTLKVYLQSLNKVIDLPTKLILPGHGDTIEHLAERIVQMKERYFMRFKQIISIVENESKTPYEVSEAVYGEANVPTSAMQTVTNIMYLVGLGFLTLEEKDDILYVQASEAGKKQDLSFE